MKFTLLSILTFISVVLGDAIDLKKRVDGDALAAGAIGTVVASVAGAPVVPIVAGAGTWGVVKIYHKSRCQKLEMDISTCSSTKYCQWIDNVGCTYNDDK